MKCICVLCVVALLQGCGTVLEPATDGGSPDGDNDSVDANEPPDAGVPADMVVAPSGAFWMGCNGESCGAGFTTVVSALPYHEVTLSGFAIDATEVSIADYAVCVADGACPPPSAPDVQTDRPALVDYAGATSYCAWQDKRLPTEAEWEYAARGSDERSYPWGDLTPTCTLARFLDCEPDAYDPVTSHAGGASWIGAINMAGNAWEWTADWYASDYYATSPSIDPTGPAEGAARLLRGGQFSDPASNVTVWDRRTATPGTLAGVRCAL